MTSALTGYLLFAIGLKSGGAFVGGVNSYVLLILGLLVTWGLFQPFLSYWILRRAIKLDSPTSAAIAACFGSISVMTYIAATSFLEALDIHYDGLVIAALAIMEIPAIVSGLFIANFYNKSAKMPLQRLLIDAIFNRTIGMILIGMALGAITKVLSWNFIASPLLIIFKPLLCLFLFYMGWLVGQHRESLRQFNWSLSLFGMYMPLIGAAFGIFIAFFFKLDLGTATLITTLTASASYIAVPAAMRMALPKAQEAVYLPLSIGITLPFNIIIGIPMYYQIATCVIK